jgi:hypothetical protein
MSALNEIIGKTFTEINRSSDELRFVTDAGDTYRMWHNQDCCEHVDIEDISGSLEDLIGAPILKAEESTNHDNPREGSDESFTWTFYHFATVRGYVTIRWYGDSNGYYSESVEFERMT